MPTPGVPSTNPIIPFSQEANQFKTKLGSPHTLIGTKMIQYGATAALANSTTETSIFNISSTTAIGNMFFNGTENQSATGLTLAAGLAGNLFRIKAVGQIADTATPTITLRAGWLNAAGTFASLATSGAVTAGTITGTSNIELDVTYYVSVYGSGTLGTINVWGKALYYPTTATVQTVLIPWTANASFDTTVVFTPDIRFTWGAASASNTVTWTNVYLEVLG